MVGELKVGTVSAAPPKLSRFTDSRIHVQRHECAMIRPQQDLDPSPSILQFAVPRQEGYIERRGPASPPFFQAFRDGDMGPAGQALLRTAMPIQLRGFTQAPLRASTQLPLTPTNQNS